MQGVPKGEPHTFKATADAEALVWFKVEPVFGFYGFLEDTYNLIQAGKMKSYESLNGLIYSSMIVKKYREDFEPSQSSLKVVMSVANGIGKMLGRRI